MPPYLFVFLHRGVKFLRQIVGNVGHPWFLLIRATQAAFVLARLFVVLLLCVFAVAFCILHKGGRKRRKPVIVSSMRSGTSS